MHLYYIELNNSAYAVRNQQHGIERRNAPNPNIKAFEGVVQHEGVVGYEPQNREPA